MSGYFDHWRYCAFGLSVALFSFFDAPEMACTALAQDQGSWSAASTMPTGTGDSGVTALDGKVYVIGGARSYARKLVTA